ncbi:hypothetical protein JHD48_00380 [Sulfurimonas sp. SAG-AH-194-I05]|nr:hypothetical protein [Sulfurimonas sp. SAG-AH-194-I05]MDF1874182.1 hypothetical protein [Sulfurimonas sp. SAG-AH-194-I05]
MVKFFASFVVFTSLVFAEIIPSQLDSNLSVLGGEKNDSTLITKIKSFVSPRSYNENEKFIKLIFKPESKYYRSDRVDVVKVVKVLKSNGLLNLLFKKPQELQLSFKTSGSPLFFVKIMGDTLRNIGYYRYVTTESNLDSSEFTWTISLKSEYATDPLILQAELQKSGSDIIDIERISKTEWQYSIDMSNAYLNIPILNNETEMEVKRSLYAHWLNVQSIKNLRIKSSFSDSWYPQISYYDKQLHLLKMIKKDKKTRAIALVIPESAKYIKISDMYTLKNVKNNLILVPTGAR